MAAQYDQKPKSKKSVGNSARKCRLYKRRYEYAPTNGAYFEGKHRIGDSDGVSFSKTLADSRGDIEEAGAGTGFQTSHKNTVATEVECR